MIVNRTNKGWDIIFQRNHALLAGNIAYLIAPRYHPPRWVETLCAIMEHDDGQQDWSISSRVSDKGEPLDFTAYECDLSQAKKVVAESFYKSKWIHLLVSIHTHSLYADIKNKSIELQNFLKEQEVKQKELTQELHLTKTEVDTYYAFLRWCDELSLQLCRRSSNNEVGTSPVGSLNRQEENQLIISSTGQYTIDPWVFSHKEVKLYAEVYEIEQEKFSSDQVLKKYIEATIPYRKEWKLNYK
ncbi:DUF3891 family protein [Fulvivirga maritima]|uniref:DUF3891 family protein n=1 Tax=Fulvivirga maritima TaxID=2904247 RepID=UPI001F43C38F|nr:DUF3891 family protein [Fulvivirga maritima]UII26033.1 DUF3891 family protein [Fulvivirga maritima]